MAGKWRPPFPRRIQRVNPLRERAAARDLILYNCPRSPIRPSARREMHRTIVLAGFAALLAATTIPLSPPARAQIGNIFTDPVPRPPANIPRGNQPPPDEEEEVPALPQGRVLPARPMPPGQGSALPGPVTSAPLAPPPGTTMLPQNVPPSVGVAPPQPGQPTQANLPPGANPV